MSALLDEATRIAREFDYPADQVRRGVAEYIRQSDEGLSKENTTLSQIPTFVTSVPNGTEKVSSYPGVAWTLHLPGELVYTVQSSLLTVSHRVFTWPSTWVVPTSAFALCNCTAILPSLSPSPR